MFDYFMIFCLIAPLIMYSIVKQCWREGYISLLSLSLLTCAYISGRSQCEGLLICDYITGVLTVINYLLVIFYCDRLLTSDFLLVS